MTDMDLLLPPDLDRDKLKWATVTDDSPLTIRLDGEAGPLLGIPDTLAWPLAIGNRVLVVLIVNDTPRFKARRALIVGKAGGVPNLESRLAAAEATIAAMLAAWTTWTPTHTNLTVGAGGVVTARHRLVGKTLDWKWKFKYGTGSAVGTSPRFTLPYTPHSSYLSLEDEIGNGVLYSSGLTNRGAVAPLISGATLEIVTYGSTGAHSGIEAGLPWSWNADDTLMLKGLTEIA